MKGGGIKYTDNKNIARDTDDRNILYVKQDYLPELEKQNPFIYKNSKVQIKILSTISQKVKINIYN